MNVKYGASSTKCPSVSVCKERRFHQAQWALALTNLRQISCQAFKSFSSFFVNISTPRIHTEGPDKQKPHIQHLNSDYQNSLLCHLCQLQIALCLQHGLCLELNLEQTASIGRRPEVTHVVAHQVSHSRQRVDAKECWAVIDKCHWAK